jgi:predicted TIM-barrel fold metal-dependent hydrolase
MSLTDDIFQIKKIDVHMHARTRSKRFEDLHHAVKELTKGMDKNKIFKALILSRSCACSTEPEDRATTNKETLVFTDMEPERLYPVASVDVTEKLDKELEFIKKNHSRFLGIKLYPGYRPFYPVDKICDPVYDLAEHHRLPVFFHSGDLASSSGKLKYAHPLNIDDLATDRPNLKIVICHFGNPWILDAAEVAYKNKNVYIDLSGLVTSKGGNKRKYMKVLADNISKAIHYMEGCDKILFGSDWPMAEASDTILLIKELKIGEDNLHEIFYKNAENLFNLHER